MKSIKYPIIALILCSLTLISCVKEESIDLSKTKDKEGYAIGYQVGLSFKKRGFDAPSAALAQGINDALKDTPKLSDSEIQNTIKSYERRIAQQLIDSHNKTAKSNLENANTYLATNSTKEGINTLKSGIQYKIIKNGSGLNSPEKNDQVTVHYTGRLIDGTVFDSSVSRGKPATFPLNRVIPGWTETLQLMSEGDIWEVTIPPHLAYGESGGGGKIGPNQVLIFEIELIKVK